MAGQKRGQNEANIEDPPKGAWFDRYKQCTVCKQWLLESDGWSHTTVYIGGVKFESSWICNTCWAKTTAASPPPSTAPPKPDSGNDEHPDEKNVPKKKKGGRTLKPIPEIYLEANPRDEDPDEKNGTKKK